MEKNRGVNSTGFHVLIILSLVLTLSLFCELPAFAGNIYSPSMVTLDAESVSYDDESGKAVAEGNAVLTYQGATVRADRINYDVFSNKIHAVPNPGGSVVLESMGRRVVGDSLEYDLNTQEGTMSGVKSGFPVGDGVLFIYGGGMQLMPYDLALARGLVKNRRNPPSYAGYAENVTVTTCTLDHPHYRLKTKSMVFIPGRRVVAKRPRLYLGNTFVFAYPMDYIVHIDRKAMQHNFMPYLQHNEKKGTGVGSTGAFSWETGSLSLGAAYWGKTGFEGMAAVEQSLGSGFSISGGIEHIWSDAWEGKQNTSRAALSYGNNGWEAALRMSWNEYIEIQKDAIHEYRGRLDRTPELTVLTPFIRDRTAKKSWFRLGAIAGRYWERIPGHSFDTVTRYGGILWHYLEHPVGRNVTFFANSSYSAWFYNKEGSQDILYSFLGFRYNLGSLQLGTGYERRFAWGRSPMEWDNEGDAERIHQKIRIPLGREFSLEARGSYDTHVSMIDELNYALQWSTDCMRWELRYRDDRTSGSNRSFGLSVFILAYPNTPASFGELRPHDPFTPIGLPDSTP